METTAKNIARSIVKVLAYVGGKALCATAVMLIIIAFIAAALLTTPLVILGYGYQLIKNI